MSSSNKKKAAPKKKATPKKKIAPKKKKYPRRNTPPRKDDGFCYFTTACTEYYGLPDNCYQLETLRKFRDNKMSQNPEDREMVSLYYAVAPSIVSKIKQSEKPEVEFAMIFDHINEACSLIERNKSNRAKKVYIDMVLTLLKKYQIK